jgi:hypothetical protein
VVSENVGRFYLQTPASTGVTNNSYVFNINAAAGAWKLGRYVGGSYTELASVPTTIDASTHAYQFSVNRSTGALAVTVDGGALISANDTSHSTFNKITLAVATGSDGTKHTYIDNLVIAAGAQ